MSRGSWPRVRLLIGEQPCVVVVAVAAGWLVVVAAVAAVAVVGDGGRSVGRAAVVVNRTVFVVEARVACKVDRAGVRPLRSQSFEHSREIIYIVTIVLCIKPSRIQLCCSRRAIMPQNLGSTPGSRQEP